MTIRAEHSQVLFETVTRISVDVIRLSQRPAIVWMLLIPTTLATSRAVLFSQIPLNVARQLKRLTTSAINFLVEPLFNVLPILMFVLTCNGAVKFLTLHPALFKCRSTGTTSHDPPLYGMSAVCQGPSVKDSNHQPSVRADALSIWSYPRGCSGGRGRIRTSTEPADLWVTATYPA